MIQELKMNMMYRYLLATLAVFGLTACDDLFQNVNEDVDVDFLSEVLNEKQEAIQAEKVEFSPDYKTFTMTTYLHKDIGQYELKDTTKIRTEVVETINGLHRAKISTPHLISIKNVEADRIAENDVRMLVLVDLTLPQNELDHVKLYVGEMRTVFNHDNLFVAFMEGPEVGKTMKVTDYVLDNYFKKSKEQYVYLYRSMLAKKKEIMGGEEMWQDAKKRVMITFSNDKLYDEETDEPYDPDYYQYESLMVQADTVNSNSFAAFYSTIKRPGNTDEQEENVLGVFCNLNGGSFIENFSWVSFKRILYSTFNLHFPDNEFLFENPDFKVYRGDKKKLTLNFYNIESDSLIASVSTTVVLGSVYHPIIVHGHDILYVILQGSFLGIFILFSVWLILQFVVPFIRYRIFLHKHVIQYRGQNMSVNEKIVQENCYLCKAPFEVGDKIVVKCEHTMHKECWDENSYHCPEYSDRCKHGSHYYNPHNLLDSRNAPFFMKWILVAIISTIAAWLGFTLYTHYCYDFVLSKYMHDPVTQIPAFGVDIGFFLTFGMSMLAVRPGKDGNIIGSLLLRAFVASMGCYLSFMLINLIILLFNIRIFLFLLNWIPWMTSAFVISYCSTFGTRIIHNKLLVVITVVISFLSMHAWSILFRFMELDYRVLIFFSFLIYGIGLVCCMATVAPRSERYFLKVQGAAKGMDIALYKWFRNHHDKVVTIGKSVDCSLQLSWDLQGDVAPVQAEIRLIQNIPYLTALEPGVLIHGKDIEINKRVRLYHGKTFVIGMTTFTYIEKD